MRFLGQEDAFPPS